MADTPRTSTDLLTNLFQDGQAAGSITAQDLRDFIVSVKQPYGHYARNVASATTISVAGTYVKAAGTTTLHKGDDMDDDSSTNNRLKYTAALTKNFLVVASLSFTSASSSQVLGFKLAKNGTVIDNSVARRSHGTGSDIGTATITTHISLAQNDYLEVWVTNETTATNVTLNEFSLMAWSVFE